MEKRIEDLEFRMNLLFTNTPADRFIYESGITETEYRSIMDLFEQYRHMIDNGEDVHHTSFEHEIYELVPSKNGDYHFCEFIAKVFAEEGRWEEVFSTLYGSMPKYGGSI